MELEHYEDGAIRMMIRKCQRNKHIHQVSFSTYHDCLTQVCFTCEEVRTSMDEEDYIKSTNPADQYRKDHATLSQEELDNLNDIDDTNYEVNSQGERATSRRASESISNKRDIGNPDVEDTKKAPKEGDIVVCPICEESYMTWVCLGEPEGDFYSCEQCNGKFDKDFRDLNDLEDRLCEPELKSHDNSLPFFFLDIENVRHHIRYCQKENHVQQVAYSTYHDCLTQICFNCKRVLTSMKDEDINQEQTQLKDILAITNIKINSSDFEDTNQEKGEPK